jgi:creatinine amidohydrolase
LTPRLLAELVEQIVEWAYVAGFRRFLFVNGHVTNAAPLRCALETLRYRHAEGMFAVINLAQISPRVRACFEADGVDWLDNAAETSLMLALAPELVRTDKLATSDDPDRTAGLVFTHPVSRTSKNGVTGAPSLGTVAQGEQLYAWMVEDLAALIRRAQGEIPPLDP